MNSALQIGRIYRGLNRRLKRLGQKYPARVQCNICGWTGRTLSSDAWHKHVVCPECGSQVRHRLLLAGIERLPELAAERLVKGKRVLHFAPESVLADFFQREAGEYRTADYLREQVDFQVDMCRMPEVATGSFDLVIACDVLEHVPDDSAAVAELFRILAPGGCAILSIPQKDGLATKYEDASITSPEGRLAAFGQDDHLRIYGDDFDRFLAAHGFQVNVVNAGRFAPDIVKRYVLHPPVLSTHPLATNHRRIYFAFRPAVQA
jgi:SAM-dependent methyltransferase